jgi:hypothetical protein
MKQQLYEAGMVSAQQAQVNLILIVAEENLTEATARPAAFYFSG